MADYRVQWEIDVKADTPNEAAIAARRLAVNAGYPSSDATFEVGVFERVSESGGIDDGPMFKRVADMVVEPDALRPSCYRAVPIYDDLEAT